MTGGGRQGRLAWLDRPLLLASLGLCVCGVLTVYSSTVAAHGYTLALKQALWVMIGLAGLCLAARIDYRHWGEASPLIYVLAIAALGGLLLVGDAISGARSWFRLGPLRVQPSEFAKIATLLLLARVLSRYRRPHADLGLLLLVGLLAGLPLLLVAAQPDMGTALTFAALALAVLLVTGVTRRLALLLGLSGAAATVASWLFVLKDYQKQRILTFFQPESDPLKAGYQTIQSKIAIGSGGPFGKGWVAGTQSQLDFLPERHTDFVFSVFAEEWGFLGSLVVLALYGLLLWSLASAAIAARDRLGAYLAIGIMALVATHLAVNLGMVTGLMPTIGIPLPLMSYGGSSVVSTMFAVGLAMSVRTRRFGNH